MQRSDIFTELALTEHEDIVDAAVFGIPNHEWGEEIKAIVQLRAGVAVTADSVEKYRSFVRSRIASFKVPNYWKFVEEFPTTVTGKVQKYKMREMAITELGLGSAAEQRTA